MIIIKDDDWNVIGEDDWSGRPVDYADCLVHGREMTGFAWYEAGDKVWHARDFAGWRSDALPGDRWMSYDTYDGYIQLISKQDLKRGEIILPLENQVQKIDLTLRRFFRWDDWKDRPAAENLFLVDKCNAYGRFLWTLKGFNALEDGDYYIEIDLRG
jgi:hypothetical protein